MKVVTVTQEIFNQGNLQMKFKFRHFGKSSQLVIKYIMRKLRKYHGEFFESNKTIAEAVGVSVRTVQNAIKRAEQVEMFIVSSRFEETFSGHMRQTSNKIQLLCYEETKQVAKKVIEKVRKVKSVLIKKDSKKTQQKSKQSKQQKKENLSTKMPIRKELVPTYISTNRNYPTGIPERKETEEDLNELKELIKNISGIK